MTHKRIDCASVLSTFPETQVRSNGTSDQRSVCNSPCRRADTHADFKPCLDMEELPHRSCELWPRLLALVSGLDYVDEKGLLRGGDPETADGGSDGKGEKGP